MLPLGYDLVFEEVEGIRKRRKEDPLQESCDGSSNGAGVRCSTKMRIVRENMQQGIQ